MDRTSATGYVDIGGGKRGYRDRDLAGGLAGTKLVAADQNAVQEELVGLIEAAGLTPDDTDLKQVAKAVQRQRTNYAADSGTANAMAVTLSPAPASLADLVGVPIRVKKTSAANTGAATLNVNGLGAAAITHPDGAALAGGELPASAMFEVIGTGTGFVLVTEAGGVSPSRTVNGRVKLANGLLLQWGSSVFAGLATVSFPIAFPNACLQVCVCEGAAGTGTWGAGIPTVHGVSSAAAGSYVGRSLIWSGGSWSGATTLTQNFTAVGY